MSVLCGAWHPREAGSTCWFPLLSLRKETGTKPGNEILVVNVLPLCYVFKEVPSCLWIPHSGKADQLQMYCTEYNDKSSFSFSRKKRN